MNSMRPDLCKYGIDFILYDAPDYIAAVYPRQGNDPEYRSKMIFAETEQFNIYLGGGTK
jgi:hypothetical protein